MTGHCGLQGCWGLMLHMCQSPKAGPFHMILLSRYLISVYWVGR